MKFVRGVNAVMALRNLSLGKNFINCLVGRSFAAECFWMKHESLLLLRIWFIQQQHRYIRLTLVWV